jgi:hypothetical protein
MTAIFFTLILTFGALYAEPIIPESFFQKKIDLEPQEDEEVAVERILSLLARQQEELFKIKKLIIELKQSKEIFIKGDLSKLHARFIVETARKILALVRENHLEHLFSSDFMEDLAVYAQIGKHDGSNILH